MQGKSNNIIYIMQNNLTLSVVSTSSLLRHFGFEVNAILVNREGFLFCALNNPIGDYDLLLQLPSLLNFGFYSNFFFLWLFLFFCKSLYLCFINFLIVTLF